MHYNILTFWRFCSDFYFGLSSWKHNTYTFNTWNWFNNLMQECFNDLTFNYLDCIIYLF